jgi:hypothetical protein
MVLLTLDFGNLFAKFSSFLIYVDPFAAGVIFGTFNAAPSATVFSSPKLLLSIGVSLRR